MPDTNLVFSGVLPSRDTLNGNTPVCYTCILLFGLNKLRKIFHKLLKGNSSVSTFMFLKFYHFRTGSRLWGMVPILIWPWQEKLPFQTSAHRHHMTTLDSVKYLYSNLIYTYSLSAPYSDFDSSYLSLGKSWTPDKRNPHWTSILSPRMLEWTTKCYEAVLTLEYIIKILRY